MRLAIASPKRDVYSETFIRMQMRRLPCALKIFGRPIASETDPGGSFGRHRTLRGLFDFAVHGMQHGFDFAGPQAQELKRRLRRYSINVLLANYGPAAVALQPICERLRIPLVVHFHGYDAHTKAVVEAHRSRYRVLGRKAARIVAVSEAMVDALVEAGIPSRKIQLVRYGVEPESFRPKTHFQSAPVFLGVGRFVDKKAPHLTVLAFEKVHQRFPKARLVMAGDGVLLESTRNLAGALGLDGAVSFPGVLKHDEVAERMREATAFVQHSLTPAVGPSAGDREGTPVAVLEAMMTGLPVVATRHTGIEEVIDHGHSGFLVAERDVRGMAEAMLRLAVSPETASSMGQASRIEALEKYSAESYCDSLLRILASVLERSDPDFRGQETLEWAVKRS